MGDWHGAGPGHPHYNVVSVRRAQSRSRAHRSGATTLCTSAGIPRNFRGGTSFKRKSRLNDAQKRRGGVFTRREFLKSGAAVAGGLVVQLGVPATGVFAAAKDAVFAPNAF